jgi:hypothetical protein
LGDWSRARQGKATCNGAPDIYIYIYLYFLCTKDLDMPPTEPDGSAMYLSTLSIYPLQQLPAKKARAGCGCLVPKCDCMRMLLIHDVLFSRWHTHA